MDTLDKDPKQESSGIRIDISPVLEAQPAIEVPIFLALPTTESTTKPRLSTEKSAETIPGKDIVVLKQDYSTRKRKRWWLIAVGVVVLIGIIVAVVVLVTKRPSESNSSSGATSSLPTTSTVPSASRSPSPSPTESITVSPFTQLFPITNPSGVFIARFSSIDCEVVVRRFLGSEEVFKTPKPASAADCALYLASNGVLSMQTNSLVLWRTRVDDTRIQSPYRLVVRDDGILAMVDQAGKEYANLRDDLVQNETTGATSRP